MKSHAQVPAPPYVSTYLRLQGTLSEIQEAFGRISYQPPTWFVGVDDVSVFVSDGDPSGNLTGVLRWRVSVRQSRVAVQLEVPTEPLKAAEDEAISFGRLVALDFPSATQLYLRIRSVEGGLLATGSGKEVELVGSRSRLQSFLEEIQFRHPVRHWVGSSAIELEACQWDMGVLRDTCKSGALTVQVEPVDDIPVIFSLNHPWALPLEVHQDTPSSICCFKIHDTDLRSTGATESWPFAIRIMAKYGNITMNLSQSVVLKEQEMNMIGIEGFPIDLEQVLDSLVYIPPANMTHFHGFDHLCLFLRGPAS